MYQKVSTDLNFVDREKQVEKFWKDQKIFEKSIDSRRKGQPYVFYDGPPTANGKPHIGHVLTRVIKDMIPRYRTMKGYMVPRKAGWDTHGLPVELEVEKMLGLDGKEQIEEYGLEPFIEHHGLLQGVLEVWVKQREPYVYKKMMDGVIAFSRGWMKIHNPEMQKAVTDLLTPVEFSIAMLACRDWTNQEIAEHMGLSVNTVKHYVSTILEKLQIDKRDKIKEFVNQ